MDKKEKKPKKRLLIAIGCMFLGVAILVGGIVLATSTSAAGFGYGLIAGGGVIAGVSTMFFY